MWLRKKTSRQAYGVALLAVAASIGIRLLLDPVLNDRMPYHFSLLAVTFAAWLGGAGPGYVALMTSIVGITYFVLEPRHTLLIGQTEYQFGIAAYAAACVVAIWMIESLRTARKWAVDRSELLAKTLSRIGDGVVTVNAEGEVESMNIVAETLTEWNNAEANKRPFQQVVRLVHELNGLPVSLPMPSSTMLNLPADCILVSLSGIRYCVEGSTAPLIGAGGFVLILRDVTQQRQLFRDSRLSYRG